MKSRLKLKKSPTLKDFQRYVACMARERGFEKETVPEIFMLLMEECGEMAKAARKMTKMHTDKNSERFHLDHEAADVFMYLLAICNRFGIDLERAFRDKEAISEPRPCPKGQGIRAGFDGIESAPPTGISFASFIPAASGGVFRRHSDKKRTWG